MVGIGGTRKDQFIMKSPAKGGEKHINRTKEKSRAEPKRFFGGNGRSSMSGNVLERGGAMVG